MAPRSGVSLTAFVVVDMDMALDTVVPESLDWRHTDEGPESVSFSRSSAPCQGSLTERNVLAQ